MFCELAVGAGFAEGDGKECVPHGALEGRALRVEREIEGLTFACEVFGELRFGLQEDGVICILGLRSEADAARAVVVPEDGDDAAVAGDELESADG